MTWLGCNVQVIFICLIHMEGSICEQQKKVKAETLTLRDTFFSNGVVQAKNGANAFKTMYNK